MAPEGMAAVLWAPNQLSHFFSHIVSFFFNESNTKVILLSRDQAQVPVILVKKRWKYRGWLSGCLVRICRRVVNQHLPSVLLANVQSLEKYPTNETLKTVISYVSSSRGWTTTQIYRGGWVSVHQQDRQICLLRWGVGVCVYLSTTSGTQCLILKKSWGMVRLRWSTS
jgi:hypothetical protein